MEFGTDGVRGRAGVEVTAELASRLGNAVARVLGTDVWVARDTRPSSPELAEAVCAGVLSAGGRATLLGVLPTPGLSVRVRDERASAGVMVTASHNPPEDNGLKVVGGDGGKLDRGTLAALTAAMQEVRELPGGSRRELTGVDEYATFLLGSLPSGAWLRGRRVLFDAAAGAGAEVGARVLRALGAEVIPFAGPAINVGCGAVHPEHAAKAVVEAHADLGILLDGDGDRIALVNAAGRVLDGDALLWLCRRPPLMVGTVMTNLGLERALAGEGIRLHRTPVGDAHVAAAMVELGATVGGEPSGHLVFSDGPPTADGLYAGLRALAQVSDLSTAGFTPSAQAHVALRDVALKPLDFGFVEASGGRAVVRKSGTEPVVRVMVEHEDPVVAAQLKDRVVALILESQ
ncbi:phosphoglucosamine mutase [Deltaproteobacteria bacterium]|nr:phosphoglucosamine mutase [Deltaproteobacteria bacterium]